MDNQADKEASGGQRMLEREQPGLTGIEINQRLQAGWQRALQTNQYEVATQALSEITALQKWRGMSERSPFSSFYRIVEAATLLNQSSASPIERADMVESLVPTAATLSHRVRDLYMGLLSQIDGSYYAPQFPMTQAQLKELRNSGDMAILQNPAVSWDIKTNRMQTRIEAELRGRKALDRRDREQEAKEETTSRSDQQTPPPAEDQSKPGMDEMERLKEGEIASALWRVSPAYGGYFKEQSYDTWDAATNTWKQLVYEFSEPHIDPEDLKNPQNPIVMTAFIPAGRSVRLPSPYTYLYTRVIEGNCEVLMDQNDDFILRSNNNQDTHVTIQQSAIEKENQIITSRSGDPKPLLIPSTFTSETEAKLEEVRQRNKGNVARARAIASYTMRRLTYSNDSSYNAQYESHPNGYAGAIDQLKQADCDVANTYFATLCSRLNIPVRHVTGHMVRGKDAEGNSRITSGTGHAWTEIWDEQVKVWVRVDATPPGDPQMEQDQTAGGLVPGDYGEQEAIGPTDEELQSLQEKLKEVAEKLSYTQVERELSENTGIELRDARKIVKEIEETENIRLPNGERLIDVMSQLWSLISQSRMVTAPDYTGPVRKREGGEEIEDIVAHKIGIKGGDLDPATRQKEDVQEFVQHVIKNMAVYIIGDKSGSMSQTVDGETKWHFQQQAIYLTVASLDRAQRNMQRLSSRMTEPLSLQRQVISFRDSDAIDVDLPFSNELTLEDKVKLWRSLGNQGSGNGDVPALEYVFNQINAEVSQLKEQGKEDDALRVILACSDGEPDDVARVHQLAEALGQLNSIVVGIGITETAKKVPVIFNTPYSIGDLASDLPELASVFGKHVVSQAVKLFPDKNRAGYQKSIDAILAKFDRVGISLVTN